MYLPAPTRDRIKAACRGAASSRSRIWWGEGRRLSRYLGAWVCSAGRSSKKSCPLHTHTHLDVANKRRTAHCTRARTHTWISPSRVLIITFAAILGPGWALASEDRRSRLLLRLSCSSDEEAPSRRAFVHDEALVGSTKGSTRARWEQRRGAEQGNWRVLKVGPSCPPRCCNSPVRRSPPVCRRTHAACEALSMKIANQKLKSQSRRPKAAAHVE